jgi:transcriptional regulator with XRE-family HTH domain
MTPSQCRAARALMNWSQEALAQRARLSVTTLRNFERGATAPIENNLAAIRAALEAAGVEFIAENGGGAGVRLRKGVSEDGGAPTASRG